MARVLLLTSSISAAHINPFLGIAERLIADGHHVGWLSCDRAAGPFEPLVKSLDVEVIPTPPVDMEPRPPNFPFSYAEIDDWIALRLKDCAALPRRVDALRPAIRAWRPDAIGVNSLIHSAVIAAALEEVRSVSISLGLLAVTIPNYDGDVWYRSWDALTPATIAMFDRFGVPATHRGFSALSTSSINLVLTTEALVGHDAQLPPNTMLVGPAIPTKNAWGGDFPWDRLAVDRPIVYVALGSLLSMPTLCEIVASAVAPLGAQLVVSGDPAVLSQLPGDVIAAARVPQLELLPRVAACVTPGGATSVMEMMFHGVPALMVPYGYDHRFNAHIVCRAGAGIEVSGDDITVDRCRTMIEALLDANGRYRQCARRIQRSFQQRDGAWHVAKSLAAAAEASRASARLGS